MARSARSAHVIAACLVAALLAPGTAAASVTSAQVDEAAANVRTALQRAEAAGALAAGPAAAYRASLRKAMQVARQLDTPSKHGRLDELGGNVVQMARLARRGRFTAERYPALFRQLDANRVWFAARGAPQERVPVRVPGDPLIYEEWPGYGLQLHPLQNFKRANAYWFAGDDAALGELLDALLPLAVPQTGGWVTWEYYFDYAAGRAPWHSAMPQGMAVQVLARAAGTLGRDDLLEVAQRALKGLGRPVQSRGLVDLSAGRWWPLYAFNPGHRVLNGDLQVVISLYDYAALTGDPVAAVWADQGAQTALAALPRYDTGAWSMYDQNHESDAGYHALMAEQLQTLAGRLKLAAFQPFAERFADYLVAPPALAPASDSPLVLYPQPRDGFLDRRRLDVLLDKPASLTVVVRDASGRAVASQRLGQRASGRIGIGWNGRIGSRAAPPGDYAVEVGAVDLAGNRALPVEVGTLTVARDEEPPAIRQLRVGRAGGQVHLRWAVNDAGTPWVTIAVQVGGRTATLTRRNRSGAATLALPAPAGRFAAHVAISDSSGNTARATRHP